MKSSRSPQPRTLAESFTDTLQSIEGQIEYRKLIIVEELLQFMKQHGINRTQLAERMGVVPGRITKLLNGSENLTIETLVRVGYAVGADLVQYFVPKGQKGQRENPQTPAKRQSAWSSRRRITEKSSVA